MTVKSPVLRVRPEVVGAGECARGGSIGLPHDVDGWDKSSVHPTV